MNTAVVAAIISGAVSLTVATVTYLLTKKRDREAEWRKLKLDHYRELIAALSGIVRRRATPQAHARYADAVNSLDLIAPGVVRKKLDDFMAETRSKDFDQHRHDERYSALIRAIRRDVQPGRVGDDEPRSFHLVDLPPDETPPA